MLDKYDSSASNAKENPERYSRMDRKDVCSVFVTASCLQNSFDRVRRVNFEESPFVTDSSYTSISKCLTRIECSHIKYLSIIASSTIGITSSLFESVVAWTSSISVDFPLCDLQQGDDRRSGLHPLDLINVFVLD